MSRPLRLTGRGGARAGRRAAHPRRDARAGRQRRRAAGAGQGRDGGRAERSTTRPSTVALDATTRLLPVLHRAVDESRALRLRYYTRRPRRDDASGSSIRCGCSRPTGTPTSRRGAAAPRACGCSGSTGSRTSRLLDEPAAAARAACELRDLAEGVYQPASEHLLVVLRLSAGLRVGRRLLPVRRGHRARRTAAAGQPAGRRPGLGARARARLGRPGRGALAGLAGRVDPRRRRRARSPRTPRRRVAT